MSPRSEAPRTLLDEIMAVGSRASRWELREGRSETLDDIRREYEEMFAPGTFPASGGGASRPAGRRGPAPAAAAC